jgi:hypothetical protein
MKKTEERKQEIKEEKEKKSKLRTKEGRNDAKELKRTEKYDEIFQKYGIKAYKKYVPFKYRKRELKKYKKEERYEDIYLKYGEKKYNKILVRSMFNEIKAEKGILKALLWRLKHDISSIFKKTVIYFLTASTALSISVDVIKNDWVEKSRQENFETIEEYNNKISEYAKKINALNLSDVQIIMKVVDDMWASIKGYKNPESEVYGFLELNLGTEEGIGVCRHMATDVARKLNAINPNYNARTLNVNLSDSVRLDMANIKRNIIQDNATVSRENQENVASEEISEFQRNVFGNHMVTLVDIPKDNITLVIDPTNPALGMYVDGKIIIFNTLGEKGIETTDSLSYDPKEFSTAFLTRYGYGTLVGTAIDYSMSYKSPNLPIEELCDKYGVEAQNEALKIVRELDSSKVEKKTKGDSKNSGKNKDSKENDFDLKYKLNTDYYTTELSKSSTHEKSTQTREFDNEEYYK